MTKEQTKPAGGIIAADERKEAAATATTESCAACRAGFFPGEDNDTGWCRFAPPVTQILFRPSKMNPDAAVGEPMSAWPIVRREQFCISGFTPKKGAVQ